MLGSVDGDSLAEGELEYLLSMIINYVINSKGYLSCAGVLLALLVSQRLFHPQSHLLDSLLYICRFIRLRGHVCM